MVYNTQEDEAWDGREVALQFQLSNTCIFKRITLVLRQCHSSLRLLIPISHASEQELHMRISSIGRTIDVSRRTADLPKDSAETDMKIVIIFAQPNIHQVSLTNRKASRFKSSD